MRLGKFWIGLFLAVGLLTGCSSSDDGGPSPTSTGTPVPTPTLRADSSFTAILPPLSPDSVNRLAAQRGTISRGASGGGAGVVETPVFNHWFYLINGVGIPTPATNFTPNVLAVNGLAPNGAPAPNGGTEAGVQSLDADTTGSQLWKAIAGTEDGNVYLRSALSFEYDNSDFPNLLTGWGPTANTLDLGWLSTWNLSVYWNQAYSPTGDNSGFQQWEYDSGAQLNNYEGGQLFSSSSTASVGTGTSAPANQWYAFPNYYLEQVVAQPDSNPPFPAFPFPAPTAQNTPPAGATPTPTPDAAGEQAAYDYLSEILFPGTTPPSCNYNGTAYDGIRCEYTVLTATASLTTCASVCLSQYLALPNMPEDLPASVSSTDWAAVTWQVYQECLYASQVQTTFNAYNQIFTDIFIEDSSKVPALANDVGVSASQSMDVVALDIVEGVLYTLLCATGDPSAGVFANMMSMGVNTAISAGGQSADDLTQEIETTVGQLYAALGTSLAVLTDQEYNGQTAILEDWGRLQLIGPLTQIAGYNGLGLTAEDVSDVQSAAGKGYSLTVMQQLLPLAYELNAGISLTGSSFDDIPSYDQYAYSTFGADTQNNNISYLSEFNRPSDYPSQTVMQTDIYANGGNPFELFNGLNGWSGLTMIGENMSCYGAVVTIYNATPNDLWITATAPQGLLAGPGVNFGAHGEETGTGGPVTYELRPYGYTPIFAAANGPDEKNMTVDVDVFDDSISSSSPVATFTFGMDGCAGHAPMNVWDVAYSNGYAFYPADFNLVTDSNNPQGVWVTVYQ